MGSLMSTRQMVRTVIDGRRVMVTLSTGDLVEGYLGGMDDYHWLIVTPTAEVVLVHKAAAVLIKIGVAYLRHEPSIDDIEKIVRPFRKSVEETYFGRGGSMSANEESESR